MSSSEFVGFSLTREFEGYPSGEQIADMLAGHGAVTVQNAAFYMCPDGKVRVTFWRALE